MSEPWPTLSHGKPRGRRLCRAALRKHGLSNEMLDRLYRALYVYSQGFHEMLKDISSKCENVPAVLSSVWQVFISLIEQVSEPETKQTYRIAISEAVGEAHSHHQEVVSSYEKQIQDTLALNRGLQEKISDLEFRLSEALSRGEGLSSELQDARATIGELLSYKESADKNDGELRQELEAVKASLAEKDRDDENSC